MSGSQRFQRVEVTWGAIRAALALLDEEARGEYRAVPVGNHACIDCESERDASLLLSRFPDARRVTWRPA